MKNFCKNYTTNDALLLPWSQEKINAWYAKNPWPVGCNYIPHYAINQIEMWQAESFDIDIINKELSWAEGLGFNTIRVFLHHLVWEQDSEGYLTRIDQFLACAARHNIKTMFVFFDGVWDPFPKMGTQPVPKHNVHNSGWVQCPGYHVLNDINKYDDLMGYVQGIVTRFKQDERVFVWDIFNEPDNMNLGSYKDDNYSAHKAELSMQLLTKAVTWVRSLQPIQPITMAPWQFDWSCTSIMSTLTNYMFTNSDILSFHCYENKDGILKRINDLKRYGRPMLCTEYMARPFDSTFSEILPVLKKHAVGGYNWGFVAGKSQTHCPWDSWEKPYEQEPAIWFHDVYRENGEPYDVKEIEYLMEFNNKISA